MSYAQDKYKHLREPMFEVWIGGKKLSEARHRLIEEVRYEDHATGSDIVTITIVDPLYELIGDPMIVRKTAVKVVGGYRLDNRVMLEGYISMVDFNFPDDGTPTVVITAMDSSQKMDRKLVKRTFKKTTRKAIIGQIAAENGLGFSSKGGNDKLTKVEDSLSQSNESDIQYVTQLANECDMIVYVEGETLYLEERAYTEAPQGTLAYRKAPFNIISFTPRYVQKDIPDEEEESDIDDAGETDTGTADNSTPRDAVGASGTPYGDDNGRLEYIDGDLYLDGAPVD